MKSFLIVLATSLFLVACTTTGGGTQSEQMSQAEWMIERINNLR